MSETPGLQMFGAGDANCVDGVCHVPESELQALADQETQGSADADPDADPATA